MSSHVRALREHTDDIAAIATSALRRADDGEDFAARVSAVAGSPLQIITGEEEARRSFAGAVSALDDAPYYTVFDVGGGSTECAGGYKPRAQNVVSCEIGAVRLTEAVPELAGAQAFISDETLDVARAMVRDALKPFTTFRRPDRIVFVGGSATTAVNLLQQERRTFAYEELSRSGLHAAFAQLRARDVASRKQLPGINPQRADILPAGLLVLDELFDLTGSTSAIVSTNDLLLGTLLASQKL